MHKVGISVSDMIPPCEARLTTFSFHFLKIFINKLFSEKFLVPPHESVVSAGIGALRVVAIMLIIPGDGGEVTSGFHDFVLDDFSIMTLSQTIFLISNT